MKKNTKLKILWTLLTLNVLLIIIIIVYVITFKNKSNIIEKVYINDDNKVVIEFKYDYETHCYIGNDLNKPKWINMNQKKCILDYIDAGYIYLKNKNNVVTKYDNEKLVKITELNVNNKKIYLAVNGTEKIDYSFKMLGKTDKNIEFMSNDESIATVNNEGVITGNSIGTTSITVKYLTKEEKIDVTVTDKIITYTDKYDYYKSYLSCGMYTQEENDFLDEILMNRINNAGYKTRGAVVAAARFITLEFPYRINYFSENGRLHPYGASSKVDAEGRYYHKGLYLDESRYSDIEVSRYGPATWGCPIYSSPSHGMRKNGLDCSGFITWILYNAGFDCEDLGAGVSIIPDMTDLGEKKLLSNSLQNNEIKSGDLLSGEGFNGGHIALVAGIKDGMYYVAESLWYGGVENGVQIKTYTHQSLLQHFYWHVDMDNYYIEEGKYTDFWVE